MQPTICKGYTESYLLLKHQAHNVLRTTATSGYLTHARALKTSEIRAHHRRRGSLSPGVIREPRGPGVPLRGAFRARAGPPSTPGNAVLNTESTLVLCISPLLPLSLCIRSLISLCTSIDGFAGSCIRQPGADQKCPSCLQHLPTQTHLQ